MNKIETMAVHNKKTDRREIINQCDFCDDIHEDLGETDRVVFETPADVADVQSEEDAAAEILEGEFLNQDLHDDPDPEAKREPLKGMAKMSKDDLLDYAEEVGTKYSRSQLDDHTKAQIREIIEEAYAE